MRHAHWAVQRYCSMKLLRVAANNKRHLESDSKVDETPFVLSNRSTNPADSNAVRDIEMARDKDQCYYSTAAPSPLSPGSQVLDAYVDLLVQEVILLSVL